MSFAVQIQFVATPMAYITAVLVVLLAVLGVVRRTKGQIDRAPEVDEKVLTCKRVEEIQYFSIGKHRKIHQNISCSSNSTSRKKYLLYKMFCVGLEGELKIVGNEAHSTSCTRSPASEDLRQLCLLCKGHEADHYNYVCKKSAVSDVDFSPPPLYSIVQYGTILHSMAQHGILLYSIAQYGTIL